MATIVNCLLAIVFLFAGASKLFGAKMQVQSFSSLSLPQWFRVITGAMQIIGVAALIWGLWVKSWAAWAGLWFGGMMLVAVLFHIRASHPIKQQIPALVLLILAIVLTWLLRGELGQFPH